LFITLAVLLTIFATINGFIQYDAQKTALIDRTVAQLESVVKLKENHLHNSFADLIVLLEGMSKRARGCHLENCSDTIGWIVNSTQFTEIFIMDLEGRTIFSTQEQNIGKIKRDQSYFTIGRSQSYIQSFYYDIALQQPSIIISTPVYNKNNTVSAVLAGRVNTGIVNTIMKERGGLGLTGETYLVNSYDFVVSNLNRDATATLQKTIHTYATEKCKEESNVAGSYTTYDGNHVIGYYAQIEDLDVCIIAEIIRQEALAPLKQTVYTLLYFIIAQLVAVVVLAYILSVIILKPVEYLTHVAERISKGNLQEPIVANTDDEMGTMMKRFETMRKNLYRLNLHFEQMLSDKTKKHRNDLKKQKAITTLSNDLSNLKEFDKSVKKSLETLGRLCGASRVYIFENSEDGTTTSNTYEWCNTNVVPRIKNLQNISYNSLTSLQEKLDIDGIIQSTKIDDLPNDLYRFFANNGIKSLLIYPLKNEKKAMGFIGFDECRRSPEWMKEYKQTLKTASLIIANAYERKEEIDQLKKKISDLQK
jgi:methyl-accepting chemotaxis protein